MKFYLDLICPELLLFPLKPFAVHFFSFTHTTRKEIRTEFFKGDTIFSNCSREFDYIFS